MEFWLHIRQKNNSLAFQINGKNINWTMELIKNWMRLTKSSTYLIKVGSTKSENTKFELQVKVSFFLQCSKMKLIPLKNFNIKTCFFQFLWFFRLKCWFKGQIISRIHLSLPNAHKLMCFDRNVDGNRDVINCLCNDAGNWL